MTLPRESELALGTLEGAAKALREVGFPDSARLIADAAAELRAIIARQIEALEEAEGYFDSLADADCEGDPMRYVPNKEMCLAHTMREAVRPSF